MENGQVKLETLWCIYDSDIDWFSIDELLASNGEYLETTSGNLPTKKCLSMRLLRYTRQGLLQRKRKGKTYYYKLTEKGEERLDFLEELQERYSKLGRPTSSKPEANETINPNFDNPKDVLIILLHKDLHAGETQIDLPLYLKAMDTAKSYTEKATIALLALQSRGYIKRIPPEYIPILQQSITTSPFSHVILVLAMLRIDELQEHGSH